MKTRVIEHNLNGDIWYTVQYKIFLTWETLGDLYDCDIEYTDKESAIAKAKDLEIKETKKVIYENNGRKI